MELNTVAECDKELDYLDKVRGNIKWFLEHSEGQLKYYNHLVEEYKRQDMQFSMMYQKVELRKKELCEEQLKVSQLNKEPSSLFQSVGAVVEDYVQAIQSNTPAEVARTLND